MTRRPDRGLGPAWERAGGDDDGWLERFVRELPRVYPDRPCRAQAPSREGWVLGPLRGPAGR